MREKKTSRTSKKFRIDFFFFVFVLIFDKRTTAHWHRHFKISREKKKKTKKRTHVYTQQTCFFLSTSRIYIDRINSQLIIRVGCGPTFCVA